LCQTQRNAAQTLCQTQRNAAQTLCQTQRSAAQALCQTQRNAVQALCQTQRSAAKALRQMVRVMVGDEAVSSESQRGMSQCPRCKSPMLATEPERRPAAALWLRAATAFPQSATLAVWRCDRCGLDGARIGSNN
jgi:hypothetical protein